MLMHGIGADIGALNDGQPDVTAGAQGKTRYRLAHYIPLTAADAGVPIDAKRNGVKP